MPVISKIQIFSKSIVHRTILQKALTAARHPHSSEWLFADKLFKWQINHCHVWTVFPDTSPWLMAESLRRRDAVWLEDDNVFILNTFQRVIRWDTADAGRLPRSLLPLESDSAFRRRPWVFALVSSCVALNSSSGEAEGRGDAGPPVEPVEEPANDARPRLLSATHRHRRHPSHAPLHLWWLYGASSASACTAGCVCAPP